MTAVTIDDVIQDAAHDVAELSYNSVKSLLVQTNLWIAGIFTPAGIFPPAADTQSDPGQRVVTDWYGTTLQARDGVPAGVKTAGIVATSEVINAVERIAYAVKYGVINAQVTAAQQTAFIALYNTVWT